jgi:hypothetical protein
MGLQGLCVSPLAAKQGLGAAMRNRTEIARTTWRTVIIVVDSKGVVTFYTQTASFYTWPLIKFTIGLSAQPLNWVLFGYLSIPGTTREQGVPKAGQPMDWPSYVKRYLHRWDSDRLATTMNLAYCSDLDSQHNGLPGAMVPTARGWVQSQARN